MKTRLIVRFLLPIFGLVVAANAGVIPLLSLDFEREDLEDSKGVNWFVSRPGQLSVSHDEALASRAMVFGTPGIYAVGVLPEPVPINDGREFTLSFRSHLNGSMELRVGLYQVDATSLPNADGSSLLSAMSSAPGFYVDLKRQSIQVNVEGGTDDVILYGMDREFGLTVPFEGSGDVDQVVDVSLNFRLLGNQLVVDSFVNGQSTGTAHFTHPDIASSLASAPFNAIVMSSSVGEEGETTGFAAISTFSLKEGRP